MKKVLEKKITVMAVSGGVLMKFMILNGVLKHVEAVFYKSGQFLQQ